MSRRDFTSLTFATLLTIMAQAQKPTEGRTLAPLPENLDQQVPNTILGPKAGDILPELPAPPTAPVSEKLFPGFQSSDVNTSGATIRVLSKGDGPPLLLIHGHPETHVTWHRIASQLAEHYTIILPDLRGYGDSSKPGYSPDHANYSFRAMAQDQIDVMAHFGHKRFMVAGHDRGGRVVHRLCLDHPDAVQKASVLDIAPTLALLR